MGQALKITDVPRATLCPSQRTSSQACPGLHILGYSSFLPTCEDTTWKLQKKSALSFPSSRVALVMRLDSCQVFPNEDPEALFYPHLSPGRHQL